MSDVFVSYKAEDRARLKPIVAALEAEGFSLWWDAHIGGGTDWREEIQQHLDDARCVIVAWSERAVGPEGHFVCDEAARAKKAGSYVPIKIDDVDPPLGFGGVQVLSFVGWKGKRSDARFRALVNAVKAHLTGDAPVVRRSAIKQPKLSRRTAMAGGVGALAVAGVGGWTLLKPGAASASNRIAVMSFSNLSSDPEQAYFSEGIAEELRGALSRIGMQVIGKASSDAVKDLDTQAAAAKLGVANILTGSVRRSPATIRVGAQLVGGKDGVEKWAQNYDRAPGDTIKIQSDIAAQVASALSIALGAAKKAALTLGGTKVAAAQDLLLQSNQARNAESAAGRLHALSLIDAAIALDSNYAEAHARRSLALVAYSNDTVDVGEHRARLADAKASANRAITIEPRLSTGYASLGVVYRDELNLGGALVEVRRALAQPGSSVTTLTAFSSLLSQMGRFDGALRMTEAASKLDPLDPSLVRQHLFILYLARRYPEAVDFARRALQATPDRTILHIILGNVLLFLGKYAEARREYLAASPDDSYRQIGLAVLAAREGNRADAERQRQEIVRLYGDAAHYQYAQIDAQIGNKDRALAELELAWKIRDPGLGTMRVDPFLDPLRRDPRFNSIKTRLNFH
ncbi:MAG: TIR domain-containing protein [Sphingomonas sp.]|nr:TIR domain-containing protein [Sphingomonas sp.]